MAIDGSPRRSRRALLAGGIGGLAVFAAQALGRPLPTRALDPNDVVLGADNTSASTTLVQNLTTPQPAFKGKSSQEDGLVGESGGAARSGVFGFNTNGGGFGVVGSNTATGAFGALADLDAGVHGSHGAGKGVWGSSDTGDGVRGTSGDGKGVWGSSTSNAGVLGNSASGDGLVGSSTSGTGAWGNSKTGVGVHGASVETNGVVGSSTQSTGVYGTSEKYIGVHGNGVGAYGVLGTSHAPSMAACVGHSRGNGCGVLGVSGGGVAAIPVGPAKTGVYGHAVQDATARGVYGRSTSGTGVYALATTGYALRAVGRVKFDKVSGVVAIVAGTRSKKVTPGFDLGTTTTVIATLQGNAGAGTTVERVGIDTITNTFTVFLTKNAIANVKVAWLVLG